MNSCAPLPNISNMPWREGCGVDMGVHGFHPFLIILETTRAERRMRRNEWHVGGFCLVSETLFLVLNSHPAPQRGICSSSHDGMEE